MSSNSETVSMDGDAIGNSRDMAPKATKKSPRGTVTRNPTMMAISKISAVLDELADRETQMRVLGFVAEEYGFSVDASE